MSEQQKDVRAYAAAEAIIATLAAGSTEYKVSEDKRRCVTPEGFGVEFDVETYPEWRLRFSATYPGGTQYTLSGHKVEARVAIDCDTKAAAVDVARRVLVPALAHLPAVRERRDKALAEEARRARFRESLTAAGWEPHDDRSNGEGYRWPAGKHGRRLTARVYFWRPDGNTVEIAADGMSAQEANTFARLWSTFHGISDG